MAHVPPPQPQWFQLGDKLMWPLIGMGIASTRKQHFSSYDYDVMADLALCHHAGCLEASNEINRRGKHSAAICLVRQSVEALTIAEIGLQDASFAEPLLRGWKKGKKSHGELRRALEREIWPRYGAGLWDEPWAEFYGNLARAIQPYAHYTTELQGWQFATVLDDGGESFITQHGLGTYDALQATRITFFHMLLTWMLGRILLAHGKNNDVEDRRQDILKLGKALGESKLLFKRGKWWSQFAPHMRFKPGHDWRADT
jgi:hypothetical protein